MPQLLRRVLAPVCLALASCSGNELIGFHLDLTQKGGPRLTTRALVDSPKPGPVEVAAHGVKWERTAALVHSQGTVTNLVNLDFGDQSVRIVPRLEGEGPSLRIHLQRGPAAGWVQCLALPLERRTPLTKVYDPTGKTLDFADVLRLEIENQTDVVGSSVLPSARGVEAGRDGKRAWLVIPVATAMAAGPDLVWDVSWR